MLFVRIIYRKHWAKEEGRFATTAFSVSSDGGISVLCVECISESKSTICQHIEKYYKHEKPIFWVFSKEELLAECSGCRIAPETSNGDPCHWNIYDITDGTRKKFFKKRITKETLTAALNTCNPENKEFSLNDLT